MRSKLSTACALSAEDHSGGGWGGVRRNQVSAWCGTQLSYVCAASFPTLPLLSNFHNFVVYVSSLCSLWVMR